MALSCRVAGLTFVLALVLAFSAAAADPAADFENAARFDLEGKPQLAYAAYLNAANAGLPDAEFNVAVMLDSGRGVRSNPSEAATWYARAASHGLYRAAYNLGQLYESGLGVPRNVDQARAWFEASKLPAARDHLAHKGREASDNKSLPIAPQLVAPAIDESIKIEKGVEFVWTSDFENEPAQYFLEVRSPKGDELFSVTTRLSSFFVDKLERMPTYSWRVTTILKRSGQYILTNWRSFKTN